MGPHVAGVLEDGESTDGAGDSDRGDRSDETVTTEISKQDVFRILRNHRRRIVLEYLLENGDAADISELTAHVASEEYDIDVTDVSTEQHKRVYTALYQLHLPKMDEFGLIDLDKESGTVGLGEMAQTVEQYLPRDDQTQSVHVEVIVAGITVPLVTLGVLGVGPLGGVPFFLWTALTILALLGLGIRQWIRGGEAGYARPR